MVAVCLLPLQGKRYDAAVSLPPGPPYPLQELYGGRLDVVADDEVDLPYVEALLPYARRDEDVDLSTPELVQYRQLIFLLQAAALLPLRLPNKGNGLYSRDVAQARNNFTVDKIMSFM